MSIPDKSHPCWQRLASGGLARLKTQHLGMQLMTQRLELSKSPLDEKAGEIHAFFCKWERSLGSELKQLSSI